MDRKTFLENIWEKYPSAPLAPQEPSARQTLQPTSQASSAWWHWGRFVGLAKDEMPEGQLILLQGEEKLSLSVHRRRVGAVRAETSFEDFLSILSFGDWLAVSEDEIMLLAPALVEPKISPVSERVLKDWNDFRLKVEIFFTQRSFLQVATPSLVGCPGTEPFLDVFSLELRKGSRQLPRFLPTSPELQLKKMLAMGFAKIFEIRPCFRDGEISDRHQPEFWMLEWYRAFADLRAIREDLKALIRQVTGDMELPFHQATVADLFHRHFGFSLTPQTTRRELESLAVRLGLQVQAQENWDDLFGRIFVDRIEPLLSSEEPLFLEKYPPSQAALARVTEDGWADRFELYWRGFEIANAFHELNDPQVQRQRTEVDSRERSRLGKAPLTADEEFFRALDSGMPPSGGIALGLERLFMAWRGLRSLRQLRVFFESPEA
ncbi:MAG: EF-P lysine aminoacylase GenX [Bdellovibrio sp.]|nr:MAG: EF-P lysine aminoacylase GenX [Bdellovibrio sp.]